MSVAAVLTLDDVSRLGDCLARGGVAVFPADTVYGLCCDPENEQAVRRLYAIKGRPAERPAAVMYFSVEAALETLTELLEAERRAVRALLPGALTLLLANRARRFGPACGPDPDTLGLRVPRLSTAIAALGGLAVPVMQSSANLSGGSDARSLEEVPSSVRDGADMVLDGGPLPGVSSTVLDLRRHAAAPHHWTIVREGAVSRAEVERQLAR